MNLKELYTNQKNIFEGFNKKTQSVTVDDLKSDANNVILIYKKLYKMFLKAMDNYRGFEIKDIKDNIKVIKDNIKVILDKPLITNDDKRYLIDYIDWLQNEKIRYKKFKTLKDFINHYHCQLILHENGCKNYLEMIDLSKPENLRKILLFLYDNPEKGMIEFLTYNQDRQRWETDDKFMRYSTKCSVGTNWYKKIKGKWIPTPGEGFEWCFGGDF